MVDVVSWLPRNSLVGVGGSVDVSVVESANLVEELARYITRRYEGLEFGRWLVRWVYYGLAGQVRGSLGTIGRTRTR